MEYKKIGKIYSYTGPMFCGKSSELTRMIDREQFAKKANPARQCIAFNSAKDTRYGENHICTHNQQSFPAHFVNTAKEILDIYNTKIQQGNINSVFIDEAMLFDSEIIKVIKQMTQQGSDVHLSFLDLTSEGEPFPFADNKDHVGTILAMSYKVHKLRSICAKTGNEATRTYYKHGKKESVKVGGSEDYIPVSLDVWQYLQNNTSNTLQEKYLQ